jgi:hypothetical protein
MTDTVTRQTFGQIVNAQQLSGMARQIASTIGNSTPAPWAGIVWYRHQGVVQPLVRPTEQPHPARAA